MVNEYPIHKIAGRKIPVAIFLSASICSRPEYPWFVYRVHERLCNVESII